MVAPLIGAALVSGASSLLGGLFGKPKNEYVVPNYQKIRDKAEAAGFNPLTALAMAPGQVVQSQNFMGSAIADAGLALADGMVKQHNEKGALAKLAEENDKLREKVQNMTLRPKVGGVYAQREAIPSVSQAVGGGNGQGSSVVSQNSPLAGPVVGPDDGNLTGPQLAVNKDVPAFRLFGHDFYGSGLMSTGQQIENAFGESEVVSALYAPIAIADALANEAYKYANRPDVVPPRDKRGVLAGKKPLFPVGYRGLLPNEIPAGSRPLSGLAHPRQTSDAWWKSQRRKPFGF